MNALLNSLSEAELSLVRETEPATIAGQDEDALVELHTRIRRARNKYVKMYRREASAKVGEQGGRGKARPKNQRNLRKAEVFEDALARVSRHLAAAARRSAAELKAARLAAARREPSTAPRSGGPKTRRAVTGPQRSAPRRGAAPVVRKRQASTLATGARRQARRDSR